MGKRESYEPGTFCWADLATPNPAGAKVFYAELFGWEAQDVLAGEVSGPSTPTSATCRSSRSHRRASSAIPAPPS